MERLGFASLHELNEEVPDHDHWSTVDNLAVLHSASDRLACWRKEMVTLGDIGLGFLMDDPDALDSEAKIESIRQTIRNGAPLPAIVLVHGRGGPNAKYAPLEGLHRFNAVYREGVPKVFAWVAHIACCGGPVADLDDDSGAA
ncbi:hypothetical protein AB0H43_21960 [Hamadaea sp. NPDC050747]|uniref:hypothetical protein n=1 Tax=Hamadaea sp. NPDC050747 TaxID=3155789 RepID=UPI0033D50212